ncbi:DUF2865 domain-containing protein [Rhodoplanes roseus]|uniref:DUF2865 domain-containing protein n=1 Tax=Rhodoplanes roseus TaxID=29409 RepID=A0A327KSD0_9BRAD|nr:DUF2865 domain-containing protein [Rhodoplanes roseus]RAI41197.1 hypothetical protein CH341_22200 [Rhodoplanes roseus]
MPSLSSITSSSIASGGRGRPGLLGAVLIAVLAWPAVAGAQSWSSPASAGGVFSTIFGSLAAPLERRDTRPAAIPTLAYAPPETPGLPGVALPPGVTVPDAAPTTTAFCVRLCDGRFFPLTATANVTPAKLCTAFCPASRTKVFDGAGIDQATAPDGSRYAALSTAHLYRKQVVDGCTCNGKDAFGLAKIDLAADPTLRAGDVVATSDGLKVFQGAEGPKHRAADFTPLRRSTLVSDDIRRKLRTLKVAKDLEAPKRRL